MQGSALEEDRSCTGKTLSEGKMPGTSGTNGHGQEKRIGLCKTRYSAQEDGGERCEKAAHYIFNDAITTGFVPLTCRTVPAVCSQTVGGGSH